MSRTQDQTHTAAGNYGIAHLYILVYLLGLSIITEQTTMPRKSRTHYFGAMYHVMLRGNYQKNIFIQPHHYQMFCKILENITMQYDCKIHLFCLMTNHVHLVIEVGHITLGKIVQHIASTYALKINNERKCHGHLFQGRYKYEIVESDRYLLELCNYIHYNPLKANLVKHLDDYPWSSHHVYCGNMQLPWLTTEHVQLLLDSKIPAKHSYQTFINNSEELQQNSEYLDFDANGQIIFKDRVQKKINILRQLPKKLDLSLMEIIALVAQHLQLDPKELSSENYSKSASLARSMVAYFAHYHAGLYLKDIAYVLNRQANGLSRQMHKVLKESKNDRSIQRLMEALGRTLFAKNIENAQSDTALLRY